MEYNSLYDLIQFLQRGTHLHIGVSFFGSFGGNAFLLPHNQTIHASAVCWEFKSRPGGNRRCFRCRKMAIEKCLRERREFGGFCINGVYEYTRPVMMEGECVAMIYIGNIYQSESDGRLLRSLGDQTAFLDTMEHNVTKDDCHTLARLIESYIHALWRQQTEQQKQSTSPLIDNVKAFVATNLEYAIGISDAARLFHYHEQYLGRLFKRETGMRFSDYVNRERVKRATEYLSDGENVITVAYRVGFQNVTYFNRVFKRYYGKTPSEYRKDAERK